MSLDSIPNLPQGVANTRYHELRTVTFGNFRFRRVAPFGSGTESMEIPETGQTVSTGKTTTAEDVEVEFYMSDEGELARFREWRRAARLRLPGYKQPCTFVMKRDSGEENDNFEFPIEEAWPMRFTGPEANQAEPTPGKITGVLSLFGAELPTFT